jgi:hypothetical protein
VFEFVIDRGEARMLVIVDVAVGIDPAALFLQGLDRRFQRGCMCRSVLAAKPPTLTDTTHSGRQRRAGTVTCR